MSISLDHIKKIETARLKYKPDEISCLFIAEAPPSDSDRFFYFEDVNEQDSLYLEMMKVLFPPEKMNSISTENSDFQIDFDSLFGVSVSELRNNKKEYLAKFKEKGYYLIDNLDSSMPGYISRTKDKIAYLDKFKGKLYQKVKLLIDKKTPIILISVPVYQANSGNLKYYGFKILHDYPIEFPCSGQQKNFRDKMKIIIDKHRM